MIPAITSLIKSAYVSTSVKPMAEVLVCCASWRACSSSDVSRCSSARPTLLRRRSLRACATTTRLVCGSGVALIASGARSQRLLAIFLAGLERHLRVEALSDALVPLSSAEAALAAQRDETRFFAATWVSHEAAARGRAAHILEIDSGVTR